MPVWKGWFRNCSSTSIVTSTETTVPISRPCTTARSPESAKNSMYTKITKAVKNSTTHSGVGMTPTAPWTRSLRASSRSEVWSSHLP